MKGENLRGQLLASVIAVVGFAPSIAWSQDAGGQSDAATEESSEIVVTGTLIKGIAPTGTNVVSLNSAVIAETGATNTNQVLARIPQVTNAFNQLPAFPAGAGAAIAINRPSLRNLSAVGGSTTLVLLDGHRIVNAGILQTNPDPDVIPPGVIERVEVVPDGGSSIYGSDAVGGVINFITRKRMDGFEASSHYGFADDYQTFDVNLTAGKDWGSGSAYLSYTYAHHDALLGRDRDYVRQIAPGTGSCAPGTVSVTRAGTTTSYALPGRTPGTTATCDWTDDLSIYPRETRHSLFGNLTQDLSDGVTLEVKGFYTRKDTTSYVDLNNSGGLTPFAQSGTITSTNPYYVPIAPDTGTQTVGFSYAGVFDNRSRNLLDEFGITPTLTAELDGGWEVRAMANFGRSEITVHLPSIDTAAQAAALAGTTTATALNPYNVGATNAAVLRSILLDDYGNAVQTTKNARLVANGSLAEVGGGDIKLAVGAEFLRETFDALSGKIQPGLLIGAFPGKGARNVWSVFGEVAVPLFGAENATAGIEELTLSASGRYDHYSDFGSTFNPKLGVTYKPVQWATVRANWGKSFNAPSLADTNGPDTRAQILPVSPFRPSTSPFFPDFFRPTVLLAGGNPNLGPQKATTLSAGLDLKPVEGLVLSGTYWNIKIKDQIALIPFFTPAAFTPAYASYVTLNPTLSQLTAAVGSMRLDGAPSLASLYNGAGPFILMDARRQNLGRVNVSGLDFNFAYTALTGFGSVDASVGGTYLLKRDVAALAGQPFADQLASPGESRLGLVATLGARSGGFRTSATLSHSSGYDISPAVVSSFGTQTHVGSFSTVDLFFQYDFSGEALMKDLSLTLSVNNVFDQDPPFYGLATGNGYTNGGTLGRLVQFGIRKKF